MSPPAPDRDQIVRQFKALFLHAGEGGTVSLRAFFDDELARKRDEKPFWNSGIRLNGGGQEPVVDAVFKLAAKAAQATRPVVWRRRSRPSTATRRKRKTSSRV